MTIGIAKVRADGNNGFFTEKDQLKATHPVVEALGRFLWLAGKFLKFPQAGKVSNI